MVSFVDRMGRQRPRRDCKKNGIAEIYYADVQTVSVFRYFRQDYVRVYGRLAEGGEGAATGGVTTGERTGCAARTATGTTGRPRMTTVPLDSRVNGATAWIFQTTSLPNPTISMPKHGSGAAAVSQVYGKASGASISTRRPTVRSSGTTMNDRDAADRSADQWAPALLWPALSRSYQYQGRGHRSTIRSAGFGSRPPV